MPSLECLKLRTLLCFALVVSISTDQCNGLQVEGIWSPSSSILKVVARFGIQKSDSNHREESSGYAFGNVTLLSHLLNQSEDSHRDNQFNSAVMLFVNRTLFKQIYHLYSQHNAQDALTSNASKQPSKPSIPFCERVYHLVQDKFFDSKCHIGNRSADSQTDFVRYVPCPKGKACNDPSPDKPLPNSQFTYAIDNEREPTFWFLLLLSCQRKIVQDVHVNASHNKCTWTSSASAKSLISYDIWLVNGHPSHGSNKLIDFDHQFSFEQQNLFMYLLLNLSYLILLALQLYALSFQKVRGLNYLFTISLSLHCLAYFFFCCHKIVFAHNGRGFETLYTIADVMKIMSTALFILFVLMIAKGWPLAKPEFFSKTMLLIVWSIYTLIKVMLFIWIKDSLNFIEEVDEYHTIAGWISMGFRILLMLWFLHELRHTMILEQDPRKLKFYLHFGAGMLVWFVHLPLVAMVALQIDLMWRYKIITGFSSAADVFAYAIITRLMLQTRNNQFSSHGSEIDFNEELEYYDEHSITDSETYKFSKANYRSKHSYDNHISDINAINA